jgi:proteasome assembly chaperone (PAC2) family protein
MIRLRELERVRLRDGVLVQGLPGIGLAGKLAVDYIVRELHLRKVAEAQIDGLMVHSNVAVFVDSEAILRVPTYDFYLFQGKKRDAIFLTAPAQPVAWMQFEVAEHVLDYFQSIGGIEVVGVCGTTMGEEEGVYFAASSVETREELLKLGFKPSPGGVITGACGLVPALAYLRGMKAYVLMGFVSQPELDPVAAKHLVQALCRILEMQVDTRNLDALIEEAKRREREMAEALEEETKGRREGAPPFYV